MGLRRAIRVGAAILALAGCGMPGSRLNVAGQPEARAIESPPAGDTPNELRRVSLAAYAEHVHPITQSACIGCHGAQAPDGRPKFALEDVAAAHDIAIEPSFKNLSEPSQSRFAANAGNSSHCLLCVKGGEMRAALEAWRAARESAGAGPSGPAAPKRVWTVRARLPLPLSPTEPKVLRLPLADAGSDLGSSAVLLEVLSKGENGVVLRNLRFANRSSTSAVYEFRDAQVAVNGSVDPSQSAFRSIRADVPAVASDSAAPTLSSLVLVLPIADAANDQVSVVIESFGRTTAGPCHAPETFSSTVLPKIRAACVGCHGAAHPTMNLATGDAEVCARARIRAFPEDPTNSPLMRRPRLAEWGHPEVAFSADELSAWTTWIRLER